MTLRQLENDAIALGWAAFFGRPEVVKILMTTSEVNQRNKHGLTPQFSDATINDWREAERIIRANGGVE